ncbi:DEAD-box ATP-dependent RNA helicase [Cymbomonas tetramitiformis]|uniref:RNA helicase n=1 Tax=Cymbomonas tetramitiformis TaxID=36881 RepID=A0AAE0BI89_9CHLO|nr:DEAD-box ATP-dependent RNA helicase [Cymbomonas tetramitiformis]
MWSATWPKDVQHIAAEFLTDPYKVTIGSQELKANHMIKQVVEVVGEHQKYPKLIKLLEQVLDPSGASKLLVFLETKRNCDTVTRMLREDGWPALAIHGDKNQQERDWVLQEFKNGKSPIMLATDVAARGLDVKDIRVVVNYDFPGTCEDYVHRIGRTGRAGATGVAYSFFTTANAKNAKALVDILTEANQQIPAELQQYALMAGGGSGGFRDRGGRGARAMGSFQTGSNNVPIGGGRF